jgi:hypothetical protein
MYFYKVKCETTAIDCVYVSTNCNILQMKESELLKGDFHYHLFSLGLLHCSRDQLKCDGTR